MTTITQDKIHKIIRLKTINLEMWLTVVHDAEVVIGWLVSEILFPSQIYVAMLHPPPSFLQPFLTPNFNTPFSLF
jgi:hypothetical protein